MRELPSESVPDGWFQVGWSTDFPAGEIKPVSYFGRELAAMRGTTGELRVFDAYCPHMGAHLGHTGCAEGDLIRCGYHGWAFDEQGRNVDIPYDQITSMNIGIHKYPTREIDGLAFVFHSDDNSPPFYELPDTFMRLPGETWPVSPETTKLWTDVPMVGQFVAENSTDVAHFKWVHRAAEVPELSSFSADIGVFRSTIDIRFGGGMKATWATPTGPVDGHIHTESWGLGIGWSRLVGFDDLIYLACFTPTAPNLLDFRATTWVAKQRGDGSVMDEATRDRWIAQQNDQVDSDMRIWRTQTYVRRAPFAKVEQACMRALRRWADQFYSDRRDSADVDAAPDADSVTLG